MRRTISQEAFSQAGVPKKSPPSLYGQAFSRQHIKGSSSLPHLSPFDSGGKQVKAFAAASQPNFFDSRNNPVGFQKSQHSFKLPNYEDRQDAINFKRNLQFCAAQE